MADAQFIAAANSGADTQTSNKSVSKPAAVAADDVGVFQLTRWNETNSFPAVTLPTGAIGRTPQVQGGGSSFQETIIFADYVNDPTPEASWNVTWVGSRWSTLKALFFRNIDPGLDLATVPYDIDIGTGDPNDLTANGNDGDAIAYFLNTNSYSGTTTHGPPSGFTEPASFDNDASGGAYKIADTTGTQTVSGTISPNQDHIHAMMILAHSSDGGAVDLVIQDAAIAVSADNIVITQQHALNIQESGITVSADNVVITQNHLLIVQDAAIPVAAENLTISQHIQLAIDKAVMAMRADTSSFQQVHQISIHKAFLQTAADVVNMSGEEEGGIVTVADVQVQKLQTLTGTTGTISDLMHAYYGGLSGLTPIPRFSISDHQRVYWEAQTGLSNRSLADLEKAFYDAQLVPSGSLADREYVYWSNL